MILKRSGLVLASIPTFLFGAWSAAALAIDGPCRGHAATALVVAWIVLLLGSCFAMRTFFRALVVILLLNLAVATWWLGIEPSNDRRWITENERAPVVEFDGDIVHIRNVRDFLWRSDTDFTPRWEDRTFDLSTIRAVDIFFSNWGPPKIEHTIMSWEFDDGRHLAISIETRKEVGEEYSALLGFFRQFELFYAVADEHDVIGVRTNVRGEHVRLYRLSAPPDRARLLLVDYLEHIARLNDKPRWYNALTQNCTTTIVQHVRHFDATMDWDWRLIANGSADSLIYMRGGLDTSIPFDELRRRSDITAAAQAAGDDENFSTLIRRSLPRMTAAGGAGGPRPTLGSAGPTVKTRAIPGSPAASRSQ